MKWAVALFRVTGHAHQGRQAAGIAEGQRGQVHNHRPVAVIDDIPDIADSLLGAGDVQLAVEVHDNLVSIPDPVTQLKRRRSPWIALCSPTGSSPLAAGS